MVVSLSPFSWLEAIPCKACYRYDVNLADFVIHLQTRSLTTGFCQIHSFIPHPDSKPHNCFTRGALDIGLTHGADSFAKIHSHYDFKETE